MQLFRDYYTLLGYNRLPGQVLRPGGSVLQVQ